MNRRLPLIAAAGVVAVAGVTVVTTLVAGAGSEGAGAVLRTADGTEVGEVSFSAKSDRTEVKVRLANVPQVADTGLDAFHGFHVHANNDPKNGDGCIADPAEPSNTWFVSADGHLKEGDQSHGHHDGDMPSVYVGPDGRVETRFSIDRIDAGELAAKAVILHAKPDNYGNIPLGENPNQYRANTTDATTATANTGNAGDRIACGVID
jgi:Cu-Zn family superoxide dismutase